MARFRRCVLPAMLLLWIAPALAAHGGQYRGPCEVVPPYPSGPPPSLPDVPRTPPTPDLQQRGLPDFWESTLYEWTFWWEFEKDAFLDAKRTLHAVEGIRGPGGRPGTDQTSQEPLRDAALPALRRALAATDDPELAAACLIALAKFDRTGELGGILKRHRASRVQLISEAAVAASGIAASRESVPDLLAIFRNAPPGPELVWDPRRFDLRTQCFAGYALGSIAGASRDIALKRAVFEAARQVLESPRWADRAIQVAAIHAMGLLAPDLANPEEAALAVDASRRMLAFLEDRENRFQVRAHAPTAVARLLGRDPGCPAEGSATGDLAGSPDGPAGALRTEAIQLFSRTVRRKDENIMVIQSCVLALGRMAYRGDKEVFRLLDQASAGDFTRDIQARHFAYIELGRIGGEEARTLLIARLARSGSAREKPWIALALGLMAAEAASAGEAPAPVIGPALTEAFDKMKNPAWKAGIVVALGLARHQEAAPAILALMRKSRDLDELGYCAVGLGLMGFREALEDLRALLNRIALIPQVALGLGLLGESSAAPDLLQTLHKVRFLDAQASLALSLGLLRAPDSVEPLTGMLLDADLPARRRAFAAAALGRICDREALPWNSRIGNGLNYRALVETLTGDGIGILDLL